MINKESSYGGNFHEKRLANHKDQIGVYESTLLLLKKFGTPVDSISQGVFTGFNPAYKKKSLPNQSFYELRKAIMISNKDSFEFASIDFANNATILPKR